MLFLPLNRLSFYFLSRITFIVAFLRSTLLLYVAPDWLCSPRRQIWTSTNHRLPAIPASPRKTSTCWVRRVCAQEDSHRDRLSDSGKHNTTVAPATVSLFTTGVAISFFQFFVLFVYLFSRALHFRLFLSFCMCTYSSLLCFCYVLLPDVLICYDFQGRIIHSRLLIRYK